jgi:hypothetical protein
VDDFAVKYVGKENAHHFRNYLLHSYEITTDWGGTVYSCMTLTLDCQKQTCNIYIPGYVASAINKFQHVNPRNTQHTPSKYVTPVYEAKTQYATRDETPLLSAKQCTNIQNITGSVLCYDRAVYPSVLMSLNDIATKQTKATEKTHSAAHNLLDYLATHPDATSRYHKSDTILHIHRDTYYLQVSHAHIILVGLFLFGDKPTNSDKLNGSILNSALVIKNVVASAAYSEVESPSLNWVTKNLQHH